MQKTDDFFCRPSLRYITMKQIICSSLVACVWPKFRNTLLTEINVLQNIVIVNMLTKIVIGIEL